MQGRKVITTCVGFILGRFHPARVVELLLANQRVSKFYDHEALQPYDLYWRLEPDVQFLCAIT
jgi:hypothetical protein